MNGKKIQYLNRESAINAVSEVMDAHNSESWKVIIQKVGLEYRIQYIQVRR